MILNAVDRFRELLGSVSRRIMFRRFRPVEAEQYQLDIIRQVEPFTMTSAARIWSVVSAAEYVSTNSVQGAVVECGVWRGGASMAAALQLLRMQDCRDIYMFDTFEGLTEPAPVDTDFTGAPAVGRWRRSQSVGGWCAASIDEVRRNFTTTGYPEGSVHYVAGDVRSTLLEANNLPKKISILRLDTDFYDSTLIELEVLYPLIEPGGVLIIDDYGHWNGARRAVEEYFSSNIRPFFHYTDYTGRAAIKFERASPKNSS